MKTILILASAAMTANLSAGPAEIARQRAANRLENASEHIAMKEEALLDHVDTHKWKADPEATDRRPENLIQYHNYTYRRIVRLLHHGALTEADGKQFKESHTTITNTGKELKADGELTEEETAGLRADLDTLNDEINANLKAAEEAAERSPILNHAQHRMEEQIEFGERSGRLSKGEASRLKRSVAKLAAMEDRLKSSNGLSTREREKLFEEALELKLEINKELKD
ncbi:MAG: hypothetical protein ACQCXQ_02375 [Verrucomicrobiales bacterium]|nr:hypothetical protein [Verrucomicrobiota bacterium JB025]